MKKFLTVLLAALLILSLSLPVFAVDSPTPGETVAVKAVSSDTNAGTVTIEPLGEGRYQLKAVPAEGHKFEKWTYEVVEAAEPAAIMTLADTPADEAVLFENGDANSAEVIVKITKDVTFTAHFTKTTDTKPGSDSTTSPQTGDFAPLFALAAVITVAGAALYLKKIFA